jgi:hypothetical protein
MNLDTLEALAKAAIAARDYGDDSTEGIAYDIMCGAIFQKQANPETILALIALLREMGEALRCMQDGSELAAYLPNEFSWGAAKDYDKVCRAFEKYKEMTK